MQSDVKDQAAQDRQQQQQQQQPIAEDAVAVPDPSPSPPLLDFRTLQSRYHRATRRLFLLDYDGTLTPIVDDPNRALPSQRMLAALRALVADPSNAVWIVSGRDKRKLEAWLDHNLPGALGFSAEHGCFLRFPGGGSTGEWIDLTGQEDMRWQHDVRVVFEGFARDTPGSSVEAKQVALTWHYRRALDQAHAEAQARACRGSLEECLRCGGYAGRVEVILGKANLEVRPRFVNKGCIAERLLRDFAALHQCYPDFVLCAGDDFTDEGWPLTLPPFFFFPP